MNSIDKISVIIPCYNSESTVIKCLESVILQSYKNLEIIIINDGSTDKTLEIVKQFAVHDSRILIINQKNYGVSKARNEGLKIATGIYICFVDSDDWVEKNYCSTLHNCIVENNADISITEICDDCNGDKNKKKSNYDQIVNIYNQETALRLLLEDKKIKSYPWGKLYKSNLFRNINFPENLEAFEDYFVMFRIFNNAKITVKTNQQLYHYIRFNNSLSNQLTPKRAYHFFLALLEAYRFMNIQDIESNYKNSIVKNILQKSFMVLKRIVRNTADDEMTFEKENIRIGMKVFLIYSPFQIGLEKFLYLRFFIYHPKKYYIFTKT